MTLSTYLTVEAADAYFLERLNTSVWDAATDADKLKALKAATQIIDSLPLSGQKYETTEEGQILQFPRVYPTEAGWKYDEDDYDDDLDILNIPNAVLYACAEEALALLGTTSTLDTTGWAERAALQAQGVTAYTIGEVSETFRSGAGYPGGQTYGLMSQEAYRLLEKYISVSGIIG